MAVTPRSGAESRRRSGAARAAAPEVDAGQEYCLECGLRLPRREGLVAGLGDAWQRRLPWYPGDWVWPALACLVIAALGAALAILATPRRLERRGAHARRDHLRALALDHDDPGRPGADGEADGAGDDADGAGQRPDDRAPKPQGLVQWPATRSGYTLVLGSIPKPTASRRRPPRRARRSRPGLTNVGVLDSDRFSSLHPGYLVIFSGFYGSFSEANAAVGRAHAAGYRLAYPRRVTR